MPPRRKKPDIDPVASERERFFLRPKGLPANAPDLAAIANEIADHPEQEGAILANYHITEEMLRDHLEALRPHAGGLFAFKPFPKQVEILQAVFSSYIILTVFGGNRSSKSCIGAVATTYKALGIKPDGTLEPPGDFAIWVGSVTEEKVKNICLRKLIENAELNYAPAGGGFLPAGTYNYQRDSGKLIVKRYGGGHTTITFKSYAQWLRDKITWEAESVQFIWLDEPPPEELFQACLVRMLDRGGQIMITATDISSNEIPWFYTDLIEPAETGQDRNFFSIKLHQDDNPYLNKKYKKFVQGQIKDPTEYATRVAGEIGALSGKRCIFNNNRLAAEKLLLSRPVWEGEIQGARYKEARLDPITRGRLRIFAQPVPEAQYIVSGDASSGTGTKNTDPGGIVVLRRDVLPLEIVCSWIGYATPRIFGRVLLPFLGRYYRGSWDGYPEALIILDVRGGDGKEALRCLRDWEDDGPAYHHLYRRQNLEPTPEDYGEALIWGFDTGRSTRPFLVNAVREYFDEGMLRLHDERLLNQFRTFIQYDDGTTIKAAGGAHDEFVMCAGQALIAHESTLGSVVWRQPKQDENEEPEIGECQRVNEAHERWLKKQQSIFDNGIYD